MGLHFGLAVTHEQHQVVVWVTGEVDLATRAELGDEVSRQLSEQEVVVADLSGVTFLDSSGLGALVRCRQTAATTGRQFYVRGAAGRVALVLEITGLGPAFAQPSRADEARGFEARD